MRSFLAALSMLSALPLGSFLPTEEELKRMADYYPLAGALFAALFWGVGWCAQFLPPPLAAALLTLAPQALTKGFHLDGLADTADAFLSGRSRERKLEILRDSHIGTMGVLAVVALLLLQYSCFASLRPRLLPAGAALMMLGGRCGIVWHIAFSRYARPEGLGAWSFARKPIAGMVWAVVLPAAAGWFFFGLPGLSFAILPPAAMLAWSAATRSQIGGATGDTLGAAEEISELLTLLLACAAAYFFG